MLNALGIDIPQEAWLETAPPVREMAALPPPGLLAALERSASQRRAGETVLLALAVLGGDSAEKIHPAVIGPVLRALVDVGLGNEARALALDVAFGAGL